MMTEVKDKYYREFLFNILGYVPPHKPERYVKDVKFLYEDSNLYSDLVHEFNYEYKMKYGEDLLDEDFMKGLN